MCGLHEYIPEVNPSARVEQVLPLFCRNRTHNPHTSTFVCLTILNSQVSYCIKAIMNIRMNVEIYVDNLSV